MNFNLENERSGTGKLSPKYRFCGKMSPGSEKGIGKLSPEFEKV